MLILQNMTEPQIRLTVFLAIFGGMALWEIREPWRDMRALKTRRWLANLGIFAVDIALVRLIFPASALGFAAYAQSMNWGLIPALGLGGMAAGVLGFLLLDLAIYFQHRLFHAVPWLWRLHRVHHSDTELDVTSGFRFHPLEILASMLIKGAAILALGIDPATVLVFEIVLNGSSLFSHANIRIPPWLEKALNLIMVTPMIHRIHHSVEQIETDSNFGFNLIWWDKIFGTFTAAPQAGHDNLRLGLDQFREVEEQRVDRLIAQPFRQPPSSSGP